MVKCYIQMLKLAKTAIIINFETKQYIFNISEGFQRYLSDYCIKTKAQTKIFFSNLSVDHVNGILGLLLTLNFDKQIDGTQLYGPQGLCQLIQAFRYSEIGGKNIRNLSCHEFFGKTLIYQFEEEFQQLLDQDQLHLIQKSRKLIKFDDNQINDIYQDPFVTIKPIIHKLNNISYLITTKKAKGNVSEQKLKEFKLNNNQKKELFSKHEIIINNQIYTEEYFREPTIEEQNILILDICSDQDIEQIIIPQNLKCVCHINNPYLQSYMNFIQITKVDHIFCDQEIQNQFSCNIPKTKAICNYLNSLYPYNFPHFQTNYSNKLVDFLQYQIYYYYQILPENLLGLHQNTVQMIGAITPIRQLNYQYQKMKQYNSKVRLQFLGTASMRPNKYRNVSGILIQQIDTAIILDCGEGTYNQLDVQQNFNFNQKILIWISHVHCDHHLGLATFMQKATDLYLFVPQIMVPWILQLREFYQIKNKFKICYIPFLEYDLKQEFLNSYYDLQNFEEIPFDYVNEQFSVNLQYAKADHCPQAYSLRINFKDGSSLSYSGDSRPCEEFIKLSENVDIMIHEATFTDDLLDNAIKRKHSTIKEAVQSAIQSKAKTLILTHFSQRYCQNGIFSQAPENNQITEEAYQNYLKTKTVVALDFLSGQLDEYPDLVKLSQELQQIVE